METFFDAYCTCTCTLYTHVTAEGLDIRLMYTCTFCCMYMYIQYTCTCTCVYTCTCTCMCIYIIHLHYILYNPSQRGRRRYRGPPRRAQQEENVSPSTIHVQYTRIHVHCTMHTLYMYSHTHTCVAFLAVLFGGQSAQTCKVVHFSVG